MIEVNEMTKVLGTQENLKILYPSKKFITTLY